MSNLIDASDYLLGELSGNDLAEAERLMREDERFRAEVERLRPTVQRLGELPPAAWQDLAPPALDLSRGPQAASEQPRRWVWRLRPALALAASAALLGVGVGAGWLLAGNGDGPAGPARTVAFEPVTDAAGRATGSARLVGSGGGEAEIKISGLKPSRAGEYYELWLLNAPNDLISIGSFRVSDSGSADVGVPLPVDPASFQFLDISVERDDGDASHSGDSVLRAPT